MTRFNRSTSSFDEQWIENEVIIAINDDDFGIKTILAASQFLGEV
jgi:hypothetical protein